MNSKEERIARRHRLRDERMKATPGYKVFSVMFTIGYPFVAVFTTVFSGILAFFSAISRGVAWIVSGGKSR
ncbi:hypothetical protein F5984_19000 [Rudanella paleaurantiibacter]|uniref:Uncharacterized protein n=1 Tax=Rudanella paleaurantiibacter TaxID=2614655 RepID=A0A7J5TUM6_9BACT|nr:hypothetical protein [Rudanella paleaurantiibacter]KAB7727859.1 hypothetical protein F5984_19000 [Rudanella paleaurantiibacter]